MVFRGATEGAAGWSVRADPSPPLHDSAPLTFLNADWSHPIQSHGNAALPGRAGEGGECIHRSFEADPRPLPGPQGARRQNLRGNLFIDGEPWIQPGPIGRSPAGAGAMTRAESRRSGKGPVRPYRGPLRRGNAPDRSISNPQPRLGPGDSPRTVSYPSSGLRSTGNGQDGRALGARAGWRPPTASLFVAEEEIFHPSGRQRPR